MNTFAFMNLQTLFHNLLHFIMKGCKKDKAKIGKQWVYLLVTNEHEGIRINSSLPETVALQKNP